MEPGFAFVTANARLRDDEFSHPSRCFISLAIREADLLLLSNDKSPKIPFFICLFILVRLSQRPRITASLS